MEQKTAIVLEAPAKRPLCSHYWVIENAQGPASIGECTLCGVKKEFKNLLVDCLRDGREEHLGGLRRKDHCDREEEQNQGIIDGVECLLDLLQD